MLALLLSLSLAAASPDRVVPDGIDDGAPPAWDGAVALLLGPAEVNGDPGTVGQPLWPGDRVTGVTTVLHANLFGAVIVESGARARVTETGIEVDGVALGSPEPVSLEPWPIRVDLLRDKDDYATQYDELGLPRTPAAWAWQTRVDGGALAGARDAMLEAKVAVAVQALTGALGRLEGAPTLDELRAAMPAIDALATAPGARERLLATVLAAPGPKLHEVQSPLCPDGEVLILELFATSTQPKASMRGLPRALGRALTFRGPDQWRVGVTLGKVRIYTVALADALREAGCHVRALPVPYANTPENVIVRKGEPLDGADNLHLVLERVPETLATAALGYSQGAGAIRAELELWSGLDGLDTAVILAPMGGADGAAGRGMYSGMYRNVRTLTLMHTLDPAADIPVDVWIGGSRKALKNFGKDPGEGGTRLSLHGSWYGSEQEAGVDPIEGLNAGIYGYPIALVQPIFDDLVAGRHDAPFARRGDWTPDLRELLVSPPTDLRTLKVDRAEIAVGLRAVP